MSKPDWKTPFLKFRDQIRTHLDAGVRLYHGILVSPFYEKHEINEIIENLAPADAGRPLALTIETPIEDSKYHAHFFYGDSSACGLLNLALSGIEDWLRGAPPGLLPQFNVTCKTHAFGREMVIWANLVYYLAWEIDAPYLQAVVEYQTLRERDGFVPWQLGAWPQNCDPRPGLIHQGKSNDQFTKFLATLSDPEIDKWCPDIIAAYLQGEPFCCDFIGASMAALDILVFMFDQVRGQEPTGQSKLSTPAKKKSNKAGRVSSDVKLLKGFLRIHHDPRETGEKACTPLTAEQIAEAMQWTNESGKPIQSKASRRMAEIFGANAMDKYRSMFEGGTPKSGFRKLLGDGSLDIEAVDDRDEEDDSEENDLD